RLVAKRQPLDPHPERLRVGGRSLLQILAGLTLEKVVNPPIDMLDAARHADDAFAAVANFSPDCSALAGARPDSVRDATQRDYGARQNRRRFRQSAEARGDPAAMTLGKILGVGDRAARRHGQDRFTVARMDAQGVAARAPMAAKPD